MIADEFSDSEARVVQRALIVFEYRKRYKRENTESIKHENEDVRRLNTNPALNAYDLI